MMNAIETKTRLQSAIQNANIKKHILMGDLREKCLGCAALRSVMTLATACEFMLVLPLLNQSFTLPNIPYAFPSILGLYALK
jgi:hypothetical protein